MFDVKMKTFRDSVHGYIQIPQIIVENVIDSELFQRLRYIEQTSMRILYPAARHDRFIHSLGVYALGVQAFISFHKNVLFKHKDMLDSNRINKTWWEKNYLLFSLACLLHDCAHAPFSHTLEFIYDIINVDKKKVNTLIRNPQFKGKIDLLSRLNYEILSTYHSKEFEYDYLINNINDFERGTGAQHEKLSATLVSREFAEAINIICIELINKKVTSKDLEFIARMIIGCTYKKVNTPENSLKNCIISLLNSSSIDVDGLDYIVRDAYNSGMNSWSIDYKRIIESFTITEVTVFEDIFVTNLNIDGIWLKNSKLKNENWVDGFVEGEAGFINFDLNDVGCVSFDSNFTEGIKNNENNIVDSYDSSKVIIDYGERSFDLTLKNICKLNGNFTGNISGKFLGKMYESYGKYNSKIEYNIAFDKTCLSVIQSAIDARNHEYMWVYSHPKVVYYSTFLQRHLLRLSAKFICCKKNNTNFHINKIYFNCSSCTMSHEPEEEIIMEILSFESFFDAKNISCKYENIGYKFYRTCDDDLISLFKKIYLENKQLGINGSDEINEYFFSYFSRRHKKPVWKSFTEYLHFFNSYTKSEKLTLNRKINNLTSSYNNYGYIPKNMQDQIDIYGIKNAVCVKSKLKTKELDPNSTFLIFDKTTVRLCDVLEKTILKNKYEQDFFYIYGDIEDKIGYSEIPPIIETLRTIK